MEKVDWSAMENGLKRREPFLRTKLCQLMYNWQHIGQQKRLMHNEEDECPAGCGCEETTMHYLLCTQSEMAKYRKLKQQLLERQLWKLGTYKGITRYILHFERVF